MQRAAASEIAASPSSPPPLDRLGALALDYARPAHFLGAEIALTLTNVISEELKRKRQLRKFKRHEKFLI